MDLLVLFSMAQNVPSSGERPCEYVYRVATWHNMGILRDAYIITNVVLNEKAEAYFTQVDFIVNSTFWKVNRWTWRQMRVIKMNVNKRYKNHKCWITTWGKFKTIPPQNLDKIFSWGILFFTFLIFYIFEILPNKRHTPKFEFARRASNVKISSHNITLIYILGIHICLFRCCVYSSVLLNVLCRACGKNEKLRYIKKYLPTTKYFSYVLPHLQKSESWVLGILDYMAKSTYFLLAFAYDCTNLSAHYYVSTVGIAKNWSVSVSAGPPLWVFR